MRGSTEAPFERLDYLYVPSHHVARDLTFWVDVLGGRLVFAIDEGGARVAAVELSPHPPLVLLADHLVGERPILIYRVGSLRDTMSELEERGWERERTFEIPPGPCSSLTGPGGHRVALYEPIRPGVMAHFDGRIDFEPERN